MRSQLRGLTMAGSPEKVSLQPYVCSRQSLTLLCENKLLWDFCNGQHNKFGKSSSLCMGFPCCFCWHHVNVDKHLMWPEHEWNVPDSQFWSWMLCSPWAEIHRGHPPCRLVLQTYYTKEGKKYPINFSVFFFWPIRYAFYSGKLFFWIWWLFSCLGTGLLKILWRKPCNFT